MKAHSTLTLTRRNGSALLGASALLALAGCGGGGSNNNGNNDTANANLPSVSLTALTSNNRLVTFNSRTPGTSTTVAVSGLTAGDSLRAIDRRSTSTITDIYALGQNGDSQQLYRLATAGNTATATAIGARFQLSPASPAASAFGFDFNPTVDRIRVVEPTLNRNFRLDPNNGGIVDFDPSDAAIQTDGTLTYDASDSNNGQNPDIVGAAYLNPDADPATGTVLYVLDANRNTLAIQGRAADPANPGTPAVSPNDGRLFTVGALGIDLSQDNGFDISPSGNAAFLSNGNQIYAINIAPGAGRGAVSGGASVRTQLGTRIIGLVANS